MVSTLPHAVLEPLVVVYIAVTRMGYNIVIAATGLITEACRYCCLLEPNALTFLAFLEHFRNMGYFRMVVASVASTTARFQTGVPVANRSTTFSLTTDVTILAAKIVSLRPQLASLAVIH